MFRSYHMSKEALRAIFMVTLLVIELLATATFWLCRDRGMDDVSLFPLGIVNLCAGVFAGYLVGGIARLVRKPGERKDIDG